MADFVIIGGGVYGCGVAWELARQGAEVVLLEADTIASGASGGEGKRGVRANGRDLRELPLMRLAYDMWPELGDRIGANTGFDQVGHLLLIERESDLRAADAILWMQNQQGIPTELVNRNALCELEPHLDDRIKAALYCPKDGVADHRATTLGLAAAAEKNGAVFYENSRVITLERRHNQILAVITAQGTNIPIGKKLLVLANAATGPILKDSLGVLLPVWWRLPQVVFTDPIDPLPMCHLIGHAHRTISIKYGPTRNVMISGGWRGHWNPDTLKGETIPEQVAGNLAEAVAVFPALSRIGIQTAYADRKETETPDKIPIISDFPGIDNLLIGTGWSGHGWAIAPAVCNLLASWALNQKQPELLAPFNYQRFSRN